MYNGLKEKLTKEAALHQDNQLRNQVWNAIQTNPHINKWIKEEGAKLVNAPETQPFALQQWLSKAGLAAKATPGVEPTEQDKINALGNWGGVYKAEKARDRMVYYDATAPDAYKIVINDFNPSTMLPPHEFQIMQQAMGSSMKESPEGLRLLSSPQVWKRFQQIQHVWMPAAGMALPDPMAVVVGKDGATYYKKWASYHKVGDQPGPDGELPEYELEDIIKGATAKNTISQLAKKDNAPLAEDWNDKYKVPFNKKIGAAVQPVNFRTQKTYNEKTMALVLSLDPHAEIFHGTSPDDDIEQFLTGLFKSNFFVDSRGKVTIILNQSVRGENPDPTVLKVTDNAVKMVSTLIDWLKQKGYDTSEIVSAMTPYDSKHRLERAVQRIQTKRNLAPLSDAEIKVALQKNDVAMKDVMAHEGVTNLDHKNPAHQAQFITFLTDKIRGGMYQNGFNNDIFPEEMKKKQAEAIALGVTRQSVVMADQPGSGKTFMSTATADYYSKMMAARTDGAIPQVLVISPNGLVPQNWTTRALGQGVQGDPKKGQVQVNGQWYAPSAVRQFASPDMQLQQNPDGTVSDADIQIISEWGQQVDPNKRWVVTNYNLFTDVGDPQQVEAEWRVAADEWKSEQDPARKKELFRIKQKKADQLRKARERIKKIEALKNSIKNGNFCCVMLDESQMVKNDNSRTRHVAAAIAKIPKRIAMTGTPADDNPADLYGQLELINHPILWRKDPTTNKPTKIDKSVFATQFFGGFGLKNVQVDPEAFKRDIPKRVQETIKFLDMLADFFVRREKDDINPLINDKVSHKNVVTKGVDEEGNEIDINEGTYPQIQEAGIRAAAIRKAKKIKAGGGDVSVDADIEEKAHDILHANEEAEFDTMDEQDLGDDTELEDAGDGIMVSPSEIQAAAAKLMANPAEKQAAILRHVAELKVPETVRKAVEVLQSKPNFVPPKVGEEVVAVDPQTGQVIDGSYGLLEGFQVHIDESDPLDKKRSVLATVMQDNGSQQYPRDQIVPANPKYQNRKVFIITKFVGVAKKIQAGIEAQLGKGVCGLVTGEDADAGERTDITEGFKDDKSPLRALVMTMKLGSVGFNFQVADTAIFNDLSWNPSENEQASDRVYRITSPRKVNVIYNVLGIGEDAQMHSMIEAKEASNKKIQSCIKLAYNLKKELIENPTSYQEKMTRGATVFLQELAESMRQHAEAKKIRGAVQRRTTQPQSIPQQPQAQPIAAEGNWYKQFKAAALAFRHLW